MQTPLEIRYHGLTPSPALSEKISNKVEKLEKFFHRITGCTVTVELPSHRKTKGNQFKIHIELEVPQEILVVNRAPGESGGHDDAYVAIRDAFDAMQRKLQDYVAKRLQHDGKQHHYGETDTSNGSVSRLVPEDGFGFIMTDSGEEIYFHENSILNDDFERLNVGERVRFHAEDGDKGRKATSVTVTSKRVHA